MTAPAGAPTMPFTILWRCLSCGKWSHAQRRPKNHLRFIEDGAAELDTEGWVVKETRDAEYDQGYLERPAGVMVFCGPFEEWRAIRMPAVILTENGERTQWTITSQPLLPAPPMATDDPSYCPACKGPCRDESPMETS